MTAVTINWFEIPATDLVRAADFYSTVFGVELGEMESPAGLMKTFHNNDMPVGALVSNEHNAPSATGPLVYFGTSDIDAVLERVAASGGQVVAPKMSIGAYGNIAQFTDTEGNRIALHSN